MPWTPTTETGLLTWLKDAATYQAAAYGSTATAASADGDLVGSWIDQGGATQHAYASTTGRRATLKTGANGINGRQVIRFDGSTATLNVDVTAGPTAHALINGLTAFTFAFVFRPLDLSHEGVILGHSGSSNYWPDIDSTNIYVRNADGFVQVAHGFSNNTAYRVVIWRSGTTVRIYKNGTQLGGDLTLPGNSSSTFDILGGLTGNSVKPNVDLAEVVPYDHALGGTALTNLDGYLNGQWFAAAESFTAAPSTVPSGHSGNITLTLAGTGTTWAGGGGEFSISGVTGATKVSENVTSATAATLVVTTGVGTGTLTITDQDGVTTTVTVATPTLAVSPTTASTGTTPTVTLTGTNTVWTQETAAGLFTESGGTGASIGTPTVSSNTSATAVLTTGSASGATLTLTDTSTGKTATVTTTRGPTTYYLSGTGSDSNNGLSTGAAWATTAKIISNGPVDGDVYLFDPAHAVSGGATNALLLTLVATTVAKGITFDSYDRSTRATITCGTGYGLALVDMQWVRVRNLIAQGPGINPANGTTTSTNVGFLAINTSTTNTRLDGIEFTDCVADGFYSSFDLRGHGAVQNPTASVSSGFVNHRVVNCVGRNCILAGLRIRSVAAYKSDGTAMPQSGGHVTDWTQFDITSDGALAAYYGVNDSAGRGSSNGYVENFVAHDSVGNHVLYSVHSGDGIYVANSERTVIVRSKAYDTGAFGEGPTGIFLQWATDCLILNSLTYDNTSSWADTFDHDSVDFDAGCIRCGVVGGYFARGGGAGLLCGSFGGNPNPFGCFALGCVFDNNARNNTSANTNVFAYSGGGAGDTELTLVNCSLFMSATGSTNTAPANIRAENNVYLQVVNCVLVTDGAIDHIAHTGQLDKFVGNCWWHTGAGGMAITEGGTTYTTLAAFAAAGFEKLNGVIVGQFADPQLAGLGSAPRPARAVDVTHFDPAGSSPVVGAGVDPLQVLDLTRLPPWFPQFLATATDLHGFPLRGLTGAGQSGYDQGAVKYNAGSLLNLPAGGSGGGCSRGRFQRGM